MRSHAFTRTIAFTLLASVAIAPVASAQTAPRSQVPDRVLPVAVGALFGAAAGFFLLPWVVPATALAATAGTAATTSSPLFAAIGAGVGGALGYELVP